MSSCDRGNGVGFLVTARALFLRCSLTEDLYAVRYVTRIGAVCALAEKEMKTARPSQPRPRSGRAESGRDRPTQLTLALLALKEAIFKGATWQYESLVAVAVNAGATDEQIDHTAQEAIEALFTQAERPVTAQRLIHLIGPNHFRG